MGERERVVHLAEQPCDADRDHEDGAAARSPATPDRDSGPDPGEADEHVGERERLAHDAMLADRDRWRNGCLHPFDRRPAPATAARRGRTVGATPEEAVMRP